MLYKKTALAAIVIVILLGLAGSCTSTPAETTETGAKTWYQQIANSMEALQPEDTPENLKTSGSSKVGGEFDVNAYFSVLKHVSMHEGYVLDYVYVSDGAAGGPVLYVRAADGTPFSTYSEYREATHQNTKASNDNSLIWLVKDSATGLFGNKISIDNTSEGFFEYALIQTVSNSFYLYGGAARGKKYIVSEESKIESIIDYLESEGAYNLDDKSKNAMRSLDVTPGVTITESKATVTFVVFTEFNGFVRHTYTIEKEYPHYIIIHNEEVLARLESVQ